MTLKARIKGLEEEQEERDASERLKCICEIVTLTRDEEPTPEQQAALARNTRCRAHTQDPARPVTVIEVPPMPEWMKSGMSRPLRDVEFEELEYED